MSRWPLALLLCVLAGALAASALAAGDAYEPNDSKANAKPLQDGKTYDADIDHLDDAEAQVPGDVDWYRLNVGDDGQVDVAFTALQDQGDCFGPEARLLDSQDNLLGVAQPPRGETEHIKYMAPGPGALFLKVKPYQVDACPAPTPYRFTADFPLASPPQDKTVERPRLNARKVQRQSGERVSVSLHTGAGERVDAGARGRVRVGKRFFSLGKDEGQAAKNQTVRLELSAGGRAARKVMKALDAGKTLKAKLSVKLTDAAGNRVVLRTSVQLRGHS
jgi:hypothetical protein